VVPTVLGSPTVLSTLAVIAALGAVLAAHPFDFRRSDERPSMEGTWRAVVRRGNEVA
jgi:hypothetical protein